MNYDEFEIDDKLQKLRKKIQTLESDIAGEYENLKEQSEFFGLQVETCSVDEMRQELHFWKDKLVLVGKMKFDCDKSDCA